MSELVMPALGESVDEATVTRWLVAVGDTVVVGQVIVEVSTDKVDTEVESTETGRIDALLVAEDETVPVGTPIASIVTSAPEIARSEPPQIAPPNVDRPEAAPPEAARPDLVAPVVLPAYPVAEEPPMADPPLKVESTTSGRRVADPYRTLLVRRLAKEHGVDLARVDGTGLGSRIRRADVLAAVSAAGSGAVSGWALRDVTLPRGLTTADAVRIATGLAQLGVVVHASASGLSAELRPAPPSGAALVIGEVQSRVVVVRDAIAIAPVVTVGLTSASGWGGDAATVLAEVAEALSEA